MLAQRPWNEPTRTQCRVRSQSPEASTTRLEEELHSAPLETENTLLADKRPAAQAARHITVDVVPVITDVMNNLTKPGVQSCSRLEGVVTIFGQPLGLDRAEDGGCVSFAKT